jgi:predicted metal-binding protein
MSLLTPGPGSHLLSVCVTCRLPGAQPDTVRDGARLLAAVQVVFAGEPGLALKGVDCMSGCNRACTIGLSAPGKPSYLFGDLQPEAATAADAVALLKFYRASATGVLPRGERPSAFRSGILARIPPPLS